MMDTHLIPPAGISVLLSVGVVYLGKQIRDEEIDERLVISGGFIVLGLAFANYYSHSFADAFAFLILLALVFKYGLSILSHSGLSGNN